MKIRMKRRINLQGVLILLGIAALSILACTQRVSAEEQKKTYLIKVNRVGNTITIYEKDKNGEYTVPIKAMLCSAGAKGTQTKLGTFQTQEKYRWKLLMGDVWGQYATRIVGGILFHSVYYYGKCDPATLATKEFNKLGSSASHGCVRLSVKDAKWIYDNCAIGTTVIIYDDEDNPGPLGKPEAIKIPSNMRWDPTDPHPNNPYKDAMPTITGTKNIVTDYGVSVDLLSGIKAKSSLGKDISSQVKVEGSVDYNKSGKYKITYTVKDLLERSVTKTITVTVKESPTPPKIVGVSDRLINGEVTVDEAFALSGVEVYSGDKKLDQSLIKVTIEKTGDDDYSITYQVTMGNKSAMEQVKFHVDREAPVITGTKDFYLEAGEIPINSYLLSGITVTDNYTKSEDIDLSVEMEEKPEGGYQITYKAADEAGNVTTVYASVNY